MKRLALLLLAGCAHVAPPAPSCAVYGALGFAAQLKPAGQCVVGVGDQSDAALRAAGEASVVVIRDPAPVKLSKRELARIHAPVLIVRTQREGKRAAEDLADALSDARMAVVPDAQVEDVVTKFVEKPK